MNIVCIFLHMTLDPILFAYSGVLWLIMHILYCIFLICIFCILFAIFAPHILAYFDLHIFAYLSLRALWSSLVMKDVQKQDS